MPTSMKLAALLTLACLAPAAALAATAKPDNGLVGFNALKLSPAQQRNIYQGVGAVPQVTPPEHYLIYVGGQVPQSMEIKPLPPKASQQTPKLKGDDYVKLDEGDLLLVRPTDRTIVKVISQARGVAAPGAG